MDLKSLVHDHETLVSMSPEDLAYAALRCLNNSDDNEYRRRGRRENISVANFCTSEAQRFQSGSEEVLGQAIAAAFQYLVTIGMLAPNPHANPYGWFTLTARAKAVTSEADYGRYIHASKYPRGAIHPEIERNTYAEFVKGDYESAVFKAFKTLEDAVRTRARLGNEIVGVSMMRTAFKLNEGPLADKSEVPGEQDALMHLMAGAIGRFKNPTSHRFIGLDDPVIALETIQLASLLLRIAETRSAS